MDSKEKSIGVGCGAIIINEKNEVLLVKRPFSSITDAGYWTRPGGEVEFGETIEEALKKEVKKETGVEIEVIRFLDMNEIIDTEKGIHWVALGYLAKAVSQEERSNLITNEIRWFNISDLPEKLTDYTKSSLEAYFTSN